MNYEQTLDDMLTAAASAAGEHWQHFQSYAAHDIQRIALHGSGIVTDYLADLIAARDHPVMAGRAELEAKARHRATHTLRNLKLASVGLRLDRTNSAASHNAVAAALGVLDASIQQSLGTRNF
jgi:hypothetical protein